MIITIDGPAGTGKTTVAREVAKKLRFIYFDTGAMYRAFTWFVLEHRVDPQDIEQMKQLLEQFTFSIVEHEGIKKYFVRTQEVTEVIRSQLVTSHVSVVSALKEVRSALLKTQHDCAKGNNVVFEGRDLGTAVFPQADVKVFLTADPQVRAERRLHETVLQRPQDAQVLNRERVLEDLMKRDAYDMARANAPLRCPEGALKIDTTHLSIEQVVDQIVIFCRGVL